MGSMCKGSCGAPSAEAIAEMNKKGIYMPKQIEEQFTGDWQGVNTKGTETVSSGDLKKIVTNSINGLGQLGGGDKFDQKKFNSLIKDKFKNTKEFSKADTIQIITILVSKSSDDKEN